MGLRVHTRFAVIVTAAAALGLGSSAALAQTAATSLGADAFGLKVAVSPLQGEPIRIGPEPRVNVYMPPQTGPQSDSVLELGPAPEDGSVVEHVRVLRVNAEGDLAAGTTTSSAETGAVSLLGGQLTADALKAVSTTSCPGPGSAAEAAAGSEVVNLSVGGQEIPVTPEPNQVQIQIPGVADVRVFEVVPDGDGLGWTTRMLHVFTLDPVTQAVNGEIIVAEAHTTLACGGAEQTPGVDNPIFISKDASPSQAQPGEPISYTITVTNQSQQACTVFEVTDRLPPGFTFVSASGGLDEFDPEPTVEGREVLFENTAGLVLQPEGTLTGTLVAEIGDDVPAGTYYNDVLVRT
ncbi:MAG TPA: choice-of-anchor P family protein, partial [Egibacteraceae bacterium]|nr:choice-of-anchor P family protein [Egibacteraceae bacterium]